MRLCLGEIKALFSAAAIFIMAGTDEHAAIDSMKIIIRIPG
jgi:hypothetical protein